VVWLSNVFEHKKIVFNTKINEALEFAVTETKAKQADTISTVLTKILLNPALTKIFSEEMPNTNTSKYIIEDADRLLPGRRREEFSLSYEHRPITGDNGVKKIIVAHVVKNYKDTYLKEEGVWYYTQASGDSLYKLTSRLWNDTVMLFHQFEQALKNKQVSAPFQLRFMLKEDSGFEKVNADSYKTASFQTRLYKTNRYVKGSPFYAYAVFDAAKFWLSAEMIALTGVSSLFILIIILILFFFYLQLIKQKKLTKIKNEFIDNMTHELKTPIATILAAAEMLQKIDLSANPAQAKRYTNHIQDQALLLNNHVSKVLEISEFATNLKLKKENVQCKELITDVVNNYKLITDKEIEFSIENNNCGLKCDPYHLKNALFNLIDNAIKYNHSTPVIITIACRNLHDIIEIKVTDNGLGIPEKDSRNIFEKFYRGDNEMKLKTKGFGLGLYHVKTIIDAHKGTIEAESKENKGTSITIRLPIS
jgi:signal transduction histidine kinase